MSDVYKDMAKKVQDVVLANCVTTMRFAPTSAGGIALRSTTPLEREMMEECKAEAVTRLAIDKAMQD